MLIEIDPNIFNSKGNFNKFSFLFNLFYLNRRCDFFIDRTEILGLPLFELLSVGDRDIIDEYFNRFVTESKNVSTLITEEEYETEVLQFNLEEAIAFFNQTVVIFLENNLHDEYFVKALVKNFSNRAKKIKTYLDFRWIECLNGGGCTNMQNVLIQKINTFNNLPKPPNIYLRCFVLFDSDSKYQNDVDKSRNSLNTFLKENNIKHHFLTKREIENYLPDEVYDDIDDNDDFISAFQRLSPIQKDYFDIEKGFEKNLASYNQEIQDLYSDVSAGDMSIFRKGGITIKDFKSEFPKLFFNDKVTQETLKRRVAHQIENENELEAILDKINELL